MPLPAPASPLLTLHEAQLLETARRGGMQRIECSLDLHKSTAQIEISPDDWGWHDRRFPYLDKCKERTIYWWSGSAFEPASRFAGSLIKLVPTEWGPPTFEIDGIKMLPTSKLSPFDDARRKVQLIAPRGRRVLDCCGGLGYFGHWCLELQAANVLSFEKNENVIWLRGLNPWSPREDKRLNLLHADIAEQIAELPARSFESILHDPPRFGIAGELYSKAFYEQLARVITPNGLLFHYTGTPNKLTSGRDVPNEVKRRLETVGFTAHLEGDGVLAKRQR